MGKPMELMSDEYRGQIIVPSSTSVLSPQFRFDNDINL